VNARTSLNGERSGADEHRRAVDAVEQDPVDAARDLAQLDGLTAMRAMIAGELPPPPIATLLGFDLVDVQEGRVVFAAVPGPQHYNPIGMVHGGLLCTLLDSAAGCAVQTRLEAGVGYSSIEIKVSFLKALRADSGPLDVQGRALRVGGRVGFAEAHARTADGELVGHATTSIALTRARSNERQAT